MENKKMFQYGVMQNYYPMTNRSSEWWGEVDESHELTVDEWVADGNEYPIDYDGVFITETNTHEDTTHEYGYIITSSGDEAKQLFNAYVKKLNEADKQDSDDPIFI